MDNLPKISVILSVYNGGSYLRNAIDSVIAQSFTDFELLVIDDGSTDDTAEILSSYSDPRICVVRNQKNLGLTISLNKGLAMARGEYIARMDADDISMPERFEQQLRVLEKNPDVIIVGSNSIIIDETGNQVSKGKYPLTDTEIRWQLLFDSSFAHSSVFIRADALLRHGLTYNAQTAHSQDYEFWPRLLCYGRGLNLSTPLIKYRVHSAQFSRETLNENGSPQDFIADQTSQRNLELLGIRVSIANVRTLRVWYRRLPELQDKVDMELCKVFLLALSQLERQEDIDHEIICSIRARLIYRTLAAIPAKKFVSLNTFLSLWSSSLIKTMLHDDMKSVILHIPNRILRESIYPCIVKIFVFFKQHLLLSSLQKFNPIVK